MDLYKINKGYSERLDIVEDNYSSDIHNLGLGNEKVMERNKEYFNL